jgi:hypothetical protein
MDITTLSNAVLAYLQGVGDQVSVSTNSNDDVDQHIGPFRHRRSQAQGSKMPESPMLPYIGTDRFSVGFLVSYDDLCGIPPASSTH